MLLIFIVNTDLFLKYFYFLVLGSGHYLPAGGWAMLEGCVCVGGGGHEKCTPNRGAKTSTMNP